MFDKKSKEMFISKGTQNLGNTTLQIVMDRETGANYIIVSDALAKSVYITPRLDDVGSPLVDDIEEDEDEEDPDGDDDDPGGSDDDPDDDAERTIFIGGKNTVSVSGENGVKFFTFDK